MRGAVPQQRRRGHDDLRAGQEVGPGDVGRLAYDAGRSSSIYVESDWHVGGGIDVASSDWNGPIGAVR